MEKQSKPHFSPQRFVFDMLEDSGHEDTDTNSKAKVEKIQKLGDYIPYIKSFQEEITDYKEAYSKLCKMLITTYNELREITFEVGIFLQLFI